MKDTIAVTTIKTDVSLNYFVGLVRRLYLLRQCVMLCLCGENLKTIQDKGVLIVPFLEMSQKYFHQPLSVRQTPLLISSGLVRGTTLMFGRRLSNLGIPVGVSFAPDGSSVDIPSQGYLF